MNQIMFRGFYLPSQHSVSLCGPQIKNSNFLSLLGRVLEVLKVNKIFVKPSYFNLLSNATFFSTLCNILYKTVFFKIAEKIPRNDIQTSLFFNIMELRRKADFWWFDWNLIWCLWKNSGHLWRQLFCHWPFLT